MGGDSQPGQTHDNQGSRTLRVSSRGTHMCSLVHTGHVLVANLIAESIPEAFWESNAPFLKHDSFFSVLNMFINGAFTINFAD